MSMVTWAEEEVKIACEKERKKSNNEEHWDYGCACYESALKAYKCLCDDGHSGLSGLSFSITRQILDRLMSGEPLTPIDDTPDVWMEVTRKDGVIKYQCKRMYSLFKKVDANGKTTYSDCDAFICVNVKNGSTYYSNLVNSIMEEILPITMPYSPHGSVKVYCDDILTDRKNGDFDTVAIYYAIKSNGERLDINRFFKEGGKKDWVEISKGEYNARCEKDFLLKLRDDQKNRSNDCCNLEL